MTEPTIQFGATQSFGAQTGWEEQNSTVTVGSERAQAIGHTGEEVASKLYDEKTNVSTPYEASVTGSAPTIPETLGALVNALDLTSINIVTKAEGFATMTLGGHNHTVNPHADTLKQAAHGFALNDGFGVTDWLAGMAGDNAGLAGSTLNISCQHKDEVAGSGAHLCGENYLGMIEATVDWIGVPTNVGGTGWDKVSTETRTDAQGFLHTIVTATKKLTLSSS